MFELNWMRKWIFALSATLILFVPNSGFAQTVASHETVRSFGQKYGCDPTATLTNETQYLVWVNFLQFVVEGQIEPSIFEQCSESPYAFFGSLFSKKIDLDNETEARSALIAKVENASLASNEQTGRIIQGYAAAEYLLGVYLMCQGDEACFNSATQKDQLDQAICASGPQQSRDITSPDKFELDLFKHGGDMRYFLPYVVTNCRLMERTQANDQEWPIFETTHQILNRDLINK